MECGEDCNELEKFIGTVNTITALLDARTTRLEEGMSNFRNFQVEVRAFITRADTRDEAHRKFQELRDKEIKNALATRAQVVNEANSELSNKIGKKSLLWNIAAVCVAAMALAVTLTMGIIASYVTHHSKLSPAQLFHETIPQAYTAQVATLRMAINE